MHAFVLWSQNPHLAGRVAAGRLSREITGEVRVGRRRPKRLPNRDAVPHLSLSECRVQGSPLPGKFETLGGFHV
jgi:hypothetical protein